jgi:hypothetical protein
VPDKVYPFPWETWYDFDTETGRTTKYRSIGHEVQREVLREPQRGTWPAIAAWTTSYQRLAMGKLRQTAGLSHVYYQVVDALHVDTTGLERLLRTGHLARGVLGKLSIKDSAKDAEYRGVNNFRFGTKEVRGPVQEGAAQSLNGDWVQLWREGLKSLLARQPDGSIREREIRLNYRGTPLLGTVQADGWVSAPLLGSPSVSSASSSPATIISDCAY